MDDDGGGGELVRGGERLERVADEGLAGADEILLGGPAPEP